MKKLIVFLIVFILGMSSKNVWACPMQSIMVTIDGVTQSPPASNVWQALEGYTCVNNDVLLETTIDASSPCYLSTALVEYIITDISLGTTSYVYGSASGLANYGAIQSFSTPGDYSITWNMFEDVNGNGAYDPSEFILGSHNLLNLHVRDVFSYTLTSSATAACVDDKVCLSGYDAGLPTTIYGTDPLFESKVEWGDLTGNDVYTTSWGGHGTLNSSLCHQYSSPGNYTITMTINNGCGDVTQQINVTVEEPGIRAVKKSCNEWCYGLNACAVQPQTLGGATWQYFDDVNNVWVKTGKNKGICVTYTVPGTYTVYADYLGIDNMYHNLAVDITYDPALCGCTMKPIIGHMYTTNLYEIQFNNFSNVGSGSVVTTHWDFGDGTTSNELNPIHMYSAPGVYNVCMYVLGISADGITCCDKICKEIVVDKCPEIQLDFEATATSDPAVWKIKLTTLIGDPAGSTVATNWDFGNGVTASVNQNYLITYFSSQTYSICLTVTITLPSGEICEYKLCKEIEVDLKAQKSASNVGALSSEEEAILYPNPTSGELFMELNTAKQITGYTLSNANGQEIIASQNLNEQKLKINVANLTTGIYFIAATDKDGKIIRKRFVKE